MIKELEKNGPAIPVGGNHGSLDPLTKERVTCYRAQSSTSIKGVAQMQQRLVLEFLKRELDHLDSQLRWLWDTQEQAKANGDAMEAQFWNHAFLYELKRYEGTADQIIRIRLNFTKE